MSTIKFRLNIAAQDCYVYSNHVFIITQNGELIVISLTKVIKQIFDQYPHFHSFLRLVFLRNDYLFNTQAKYFLEIPNLRKQFIAAWNDLAKEEEISVDIGIDDFEFVCKVPEIPIYDMRIYGMRIYIATKSALYEIRMTLEDEYNLNYSNLKKIFDAKVIHLNAKSGALFASAGKEGLFYGSLDSTQTFINERPIQAKSLKTSWSSYDIFNYDEVDNFSFLVNEINNSKQTERLSHSRFDESGKDVKFVKVASEKHSMQELIQTSPINVDDIIYCHNTAKKGVFYLKGGKISVMNFYRESKSGYHFSSNSDTTQFGDKAFSRPLSSHSIVHGSLIEFRDHIAIFRDNSFAKIDDECSMSLRSYLGSIRYRNLITNVKEDFIVFHSVNPFIENGKPALDGRL